MQPAYKLTTELFGIPYTPDVYILYSPVKQLLMLANRDAVDLAASLRDGTFRGADADNLDALQLLMEHGVINGSADLPPAFPAPEEWAPAEVTLFLTNSCNLRCSYCYASGGDASGAMSLEVALAAVDLVFKNAVRLGKPGAGVSYHGAGEPTLAWETLVASAEHAERLGREHGIAPRLSIATNGVLPARKVDWLARHIHDFSISYDGPSAQDRQRPSVSGGRSAPTVEATLLHLDSHDAHYGLRMTVTAASLPSVPATVEYVLARFRPRTIHLEPVFSQGRAHANGIAAPDPAAFVEAFRRSQPAADEYGVELYYSGARTDLLTATFCAAPGGSFNVTPDGRLTACFEAWRAEDPTAQHFCFGRYDPASRSFSVSGDQLAGLRRFTVAARAECADCFCKWHCAGDCAAKNVISAARAGAGLKRSRCHINRELSREQLLRKLRESSAVARRIEADRVAAGAALAAVGPCPSPAHQPRMAALPAVARNV